MPNLQDIQDHLHSFQSGEEERFLRLVAEKNNYNFIPRQKEIEPDALGTIPEEEARNAVAAVIEKNGKSLLLVTNNPRLKKFEELKEKLENNGFNLKIGIATKDTLEHFWGYYKDLDFFSKTSGGLIDVANEQIGLLIKEVTSVDALIEVFKRDLNEKNKGHTSRVLEILVAGSIGIGSSDIHFEPEENEVVVRFRIHGLLSEVIRLPRESYASIKNRIKLLSSLKINLKGQSQDGRFSIRLEDRDISVRVSIVPGAFDEAIVLRLLDPARVVVGLENLGLHPTLLEEFEKQIIKPNGMIITTGPTGSGKTTTLYSFLKEVQSEDTKIFTIENPIEYRFDGISQTQVGEKYSFAEGLRSALRQDPDVILVGEIRDEITAKTAVDAALTGHVVFSTLHTNDAPGAFLRFAGLGIEPKTLSASLNLIIAQRLVRVVCQDCAKKPKKVLDIRIKNVRNFP